MVRARGRSISLMAIARSDPGIWRIHVALSVMMVVSEGIWMVCMLYHDYPHMSRTMTGVVIIIAAYILIDRMTVTIPALDRIGM